jgi:hypothetical protein
MNRKSVTRVHELDERDYWIQVVESLAPWGPCNHMRIRRHDGEPIQLGWDDLQRLKEEYMGDFTAVEFYPRQDEVVNDVNMRHFWSMDIETPLNRR